MVRKNLPDLVYMTEKEKIDAIIEDIRERTANGQPVLVGTISIEKSEVVSEGLHACRHQTCCIERQFHAREADIVAQAGQPGAVTIATNMAGRGTDIVLGGSWQAEIADLAEPTPEQIDAIKSAWKIRHTRYWLRAVCISLVQNVMNRVVSITSCVAVLVVRVITVHPVSTCRWKMR